MHDRYHADAVAMCDGWTPDDEPEPFPALADRISCELWPTAAGRVALARLGSGYDPAESARQLFTASGAPVLLPAGQVEQAAR